MIDLNEKANTKKQKFLKLVSDEMPDTMDKIHWRNENRFWLRESQKIAIKVLMRLDELGWSQALLAEKLEVSPQQVSKIVKGKQNLTLSSLVKLQEILGIEVLK